MKNKKNLFILFFVFFFFSCKNPIEHNAEVVEDEPALPSEGKLSVQINVIDGVNTDSFVSGTKIRIYSKKTKNIILEQDTRSEPFNAELEINEIYDFEIDGLEKKYAASAVRNFKILPYTKKINIIQLPVQMPNRILIPPELSNFYFESNNGKHTALTDETILNLPLNGKINAEINSSGGSIINLINGGFAVKLGINAVPSSATIKNIPLLSGLLPEQKSTIQKKDNNWLNTFSFKINNHNMGENSKADFILAAYDAAGNRLEHHIHINFINGYQYKKYKGNDVYFDRVLLKTKNYSSPINLFIKENKTSHYLSSVSFFVKKNELHLPVKSIELYRRKAGVNENFYKAASIVYDSQKIGEHILLDTLGGLNFSEVYEYKIRAYFGNGFYKDSKKIKAELLPPFEADLTFPENNKIIITPEEFSFILSSPVNIFSENRFDFFSFALKIDTWNDEKIFLVYFKYWLDGKHLGDEQLEIALNNNYKDFYSIAELKKAGKIPDLKKVSDFIIIEKETGKITIKKDSFTPIVNYKKGMTYYWDICSQEDTAGYNIFYPCRFVKSVSYEDIKTEFSTYANTAIFSKSYTNNGRFSFSIAENSVSSGKDFISNSYIVKAASDFDFSFLNELNAKVTGSIKLDKNINETYYKIENIKTEKPHDILYDLLNRKGIISAERNYKVSIINHAEDIEANFESENNFFPHNLGAAPSDPVIEQSCYSLEITEANKAYKKFGFGENDVFAGIIDTGINTSHEEFFDEHGNKIFINPDTGKSINDIDGHGSHCAGIICALGENKKGMAGVSWKKTKIIIYKLSSTDGWDVYAALNHFTEYVKTEKAKGNISQKTIPFNMSLGSSTPSAFGLEIINKALQEGILPVAASGNNGAQFINYPAAYPGVIAVGASNGKDKVSKFSTKGNYISVCAPGESIVSTGDDGKASYVSKSGTSMAAPFVTGTIAYLLTFNKELSPGQIKTILEQSADKIEGSEDFNEKRGFGRINVYEAVKIIKSNSTPNKFFKGKVDIKLNPAQANIPVFIYNDRNVCIALALTTSSGTTEVRGLQHGDYTIKINAGKFYSKKINIPTDSNADINVNFDL